MYDAYHKLRAWTRRLSDRRLAALICGEYNIRLGDLSASDLAVFKEVFLEKAYADGFPFHTPATVVDIGAHKGFFTLFAVRGLAAGGRVVAVEPAAANTEALGRHLRLNGLEDQVQVLQAGVGAENGTAWLYPGPAENRSLYSRAGGNAVGGEHVEVLSLEEIFRRAALERVDFLKMDCEGGEYAALYAAPDSLLANVRCLSLEFHDLGTPEATALELGRFLRGKGFRVTTRHTATRRNLNTGKLLAERD
jgi:FkbM family methyltransferase